MVMLHFICMDSADLFLTGRERKILSENTEDGLIFVGYQFSWFSWRAWSTNSSTHEFVNFHINYEGKYLATSFEPHECVIFVQSTKIGTHEIKAIHSICLQRYSNQRTRHVTPRHVNQRLRPLGHYALMMISGLMSYRIIGYKLMKPLRDNTCQIDMVTCKFSYLNVYLASIIIIIVYRTLHWILYHNRFHISIRIHISEYC